MNIMAQLLLLASVAGVSHAPITGKKPSLNKEFTIKLGQKVTIEKFSIKFSSVQNDSRCPAGAQCIWAGNAAIVIQISRKEPPTTAVINTNTAVQPNEAKYKGYKIKLLGLNPYPKVDQKIDEKDYEATLIVTKH